jgi:hydroxymethylpyrimidine/phosphomethylpyrimidine kinase
MPDARRPRVVVVGGTDPLGGAGAFADACNVSAWGGVPLPIVTSVVAQNSRGVMAAWPVEAAALQGSLDALVADVAPGAAKVGLVVDPAHHRAIADALAAAGLLSATRVDVVVDPVLRSGGIDASPLVMDSSARGYRTSLEPWMRAGVLLTPNAVELSALSGVAISNADRPSRETLVRMATDLAERTACAILVKTGHSDQPGRDLLALGRSVVELAALQPWTSDVHGTGCRLSSAIAYGLARGEGLVAAVEWARAELASAVRERLVQLGSGRAQLLPAASSA